MPVKEVPGAITYKVTRTLDHSLTALRGWRELQGSSVSQDHL